MKGLLNWAGNILFFLVFVTVTENLLPGKQYSRYVRLSAGMVLILLVLRPVTEGFRLEDQMKNWFETFSFRQDARDFSRDILGMERQRMARVMDGYEQMVGEDISAMAAEVGARVVSAQVSIDEDEMSENYGAVTHIYMEVRWEGENGGEGKDKGEEEAVQAVNPVAPVEKVTVNLPGQGEEAQAGEETGVQSGQDPEGGEGAESRGTWEGRESAEGGNAREGRYKQAEELRRKVERCYGLETGEVEIEFKGR